VSSRVGTNVLVYRHDARDPEKQRIARTLLRAGIERGSLRVPHQAIVEFVQAVTRPIGRSGVALLSRAEALREAEELLAQFEVLYPGEALLRTAIRGVSAYQLGWFDAQIWAYAEHYGLEEILSEDFSDGQLIGRARIRNPFAA